jgi:hypothetical protein
MPRAGGSAGQYNRLRHRQSEREERKKRAVVTSIRNSGRQHRKLGYFKCFREDAKKNRGGSRLWAIRAVGVISQAQGCPSNITGPSDAEVQALQGSQTPRQPFSAKVGRFVHWRIGMIGLS